MDFNSQLREYLEKNASFTEVEDKIKSLAQRGGSAIGNTEPPKLCKASIRWNVEIAVYAVGKDVALAKLQSQILQTRIYKEYFQQNFFNPNL